MKWIFWGSVALIGYTFAGYAGWLWLRSRLRLRPVKAAPYKPSVSVVLVVRNEARQLRDKLNNLMGLNYPSDPWEIVVVSDASTDNTNEILCDYARNEHVRVILTPQARGKAAGLNEALEVCRGEVVVFTDARQRLEPDSLRFLAENFADPAVGCVSGELMLGDPQTGETGQGLGLYWRFEKWVRELEAASGSVIGATGALYAMRRELFAPLPPDTILDDVYQPMQVARQGFRVVFEPRARAWDKPNLGAEREFARKVRTLSGNYQLLQLAPWLLSSANPLRFEFVSHKLLRLLVPFALVGALLSAMFLPQPLYRIALLIQLAFYTLSLVAMMRLRPGLLARAADAALTFALLNTAALVAFANFLTGRRATWDR
jgi:biofilm PGA synthesis N-glycosyltransferase PgaC